MQLRHNSFTDKRALFRPQTRPVLQAMLVFTTLGILVFAPTTGSSSSFLPEEGTGPEFDLGRLYAKLGTDHETIFIDDMAFRVSNLQKSGFSGTRWTNGIVYYDFDSSISAANRTAWRNAAANWSAVADLTFVERTSQPNYIHVISTTGNWSYVGMITGMQEMSIVSWGSEFIIAHEIGHALGLSHEQSRSDRDTYVVIHYSNISSECGVSGTASCAYNFDKEATTNYGAYDFDSVMHYSRCSWSNAACPPAYTISAQPAYTASESLMGQRTHLSTLDESGMIARYGAASGEIFSDGFETGNTSNWSSTEGLGCTGETCDHYTWSCQPGNSNCTCYLTYDGGGVCSGPPVFCISLSHCYGGTGCAAGYTCAITCCDGGAPVCIPSTCSGTSSDFAMPEGVATTASCR